MRDQFADFAGSLGLPQHIGIPAAGRRQGAQPTMRQVTTPDCK
jgi:hypothetical protein